MTNRKIALVAILGTLVATPALAMDQDTAAVTINSGRYLPELNLTATSARVPAHAFASARPGRVHFDRARAQAIAPMGGYDFQLQGRGLGE